MKAVLKEYFHISENGRVREKVLLARIAVSVVLMVICLAAMSMMAYAYFTHTEYFGVSNVIRSANYDISVIVKEKDEAGKIQVVTVTKTDKKNEYKTELLSGKTYEITLTSDGTAETGFCVVTVSTSDGFKETYHTQQIGIDRSAENGERETVTFELSVTLDATVVLSPHWGTSSHYEEYKDKGEGGRLYITADDKVLNVDTEIYYVIKSGDTLSAIADMYRASIENISAERIAAYNDIGDSDSIPAGQTIKIPPSSWTVPVYYEEQYVSDTQNTEGVTTVPEESISITEPIVEPITESEASSTTAPVATDTQVETTTESTSVEPEPSVSTETEDSVEPTTASTPEPEESSQESSSSEASQSESSASENTETAATSDTTADEASDPVTADTESLEAPEESTDSLEQ